MKAVLIAVLLIIIISIVYSFEGFSLKKELDAIDAEGFAGGRESPEQWEPSQAEFDEVGADRLYNYDDDLKANVDSVIIESHHQYIEDSDFLATTGASHASARDDFMPAVQFHGLPRKAHYAQIGSGRTARIGQTETPDAVFDIKTHNSFGYQL